MEWNKLSRVLVTGANGYIGVHVVKYLLDHVDCEVIASDIKNDGIDPRATFTGINILDGADSPTLYESLHCPDRIVHLAWRNGFNHGAPSHMEDLPKHLAFLNAMMDAGCKSVSVMGTMHEVGYHVGAITESTPCNPLSLYGISKNAMRQALILNAKAKGVSLKWLRAYYILGDDIRSNSLFSKILKMEAEGKATFPFTTGKNKYDFINVDDLAMQISQASVQDEVDGIINVCSGRSVALKDVVEDFIESRGLSIRPEFGAFPDRQYDSPEVYGDASKIETIIRNIT